LTIGLNRTDGRVCVRPSHYEAQALAEITHLTADARLHDDGDGEPCELHPKLYRTIVVDPPWPYGTRDALPRTVKANGDVARGTGYPKSHYEYMSMDDLHALPVGEWAERDAHLYVWTTNAFMVEAHAVARTWGFVPKTILTWVKMKDDGTPSMKTGTWFRGATEHAVFAVRGRCPAGNHALPTALLTRRFPHSEKPAAFYDMAESMSPGPYLDVFARKHRFGWSVYGDQVYSDIPLVT
jgi:N6-adenosine-specific RNA methylase IME4